MTLQDLVDKASKRVSVVMGAPFEFCWVESGNVKLQDASERGGTIGGDFIAGGFGIAKYPITNAQYQVFLNHPNGYGNPTWYDFSPQATQWRKDHPHPRPTAFDGPELPRTRVNWFDSMAFCAWLPNELSESPSTPFAIGNPESWLVRLPTEQEWQRAAVGDTGWCYPWGNELDETRGNFANKIGQASPVGTYPAGVSPFGAYDMIGQVWEWCISAWGVAGQESSATFDVSGYTHRVFRGGAWNISNPLYLQAIDRTGHPPRGRLNDAGFRCVFIPPPA